MAVVWFISITMHFSGESLRLIVCPRHCCVISRSQESFKRLLLFDPKFPQAKEVNVRLGVMYKWKGEFAASLEVGLFIHSVILYLSLHMILYNAQCFTFLFINKLYIDWLGYV